jgi:hypothetical protein
MVTRVSVNSSALAGAGKLCRKISSTAKQQSDA